MKSFGGNLREDSVRALPYLRAGRKYANAPFAGRFCSDDGFQVFLARAGEARAVHERCETDALLLSRILIRLRELLLLRLVIGQLEGATEQSFQINFFVNHLAGRRRFAFVDEVAAAKLFRAESDCLRYLVQVTFERKDALRRTEAAKCSVRRHVRRHSAALDADVRAKIWPGGVNRAAREDDGREGGISSAVNDEIYLHAEQLSFTRDSRAMLRP